MTLTDSLTDISGRLDETFPYLGEAVGLLVTWTVVLLLVRHFHRLFGLLEARRRHFQLDERTLVSLDRICDIFFYLLGIFASLVILGVTGALYAGLTAFGVIGLAVGFAGREVLSNTLAGVVLLLDRPFIIGDYIEVGSHGGTVRRLSLRACEIERSDGLSVTLPNGYLTSHAIVNFSKNPLRRIDLKLALLHLTDLPRAIELARELVEGLPERVPERAVAVVVNDVTDYIVNLVVRCWVPRQDFGDVKSRALLGLTELFKREGIELAVPLRKRV